MPTSSDDVFFDGTVSSVPCENAGYGLSSVAGLHLVGEYYGTVTDAAGPNDEATLPPASNA